VPFLKKYINHEINLIPANFNRLAGDDKKEWTELKENISQNYVKHLYPHVGGEGTVKQAYDIKQNFNVEKSNNSVRQIDDKKLLFPIHVNFKEFETQEELFKGIRDWWVNTKNRAEKTIKTRIGAARFTANHVLYPVNWFTFDQEPEQIINLLLYLINVEYKQKAIETGNQNYGINQIHNIWKTVNTFAEAKGVDISWWGWSPPPRPENKVKQIPRPKTVNRLIRHRYTNKKYTDALIRTLLTVGFQSGLRPEELIILQVKDIDFESGYIIITEQKKRHRNRQIRLEHDVMYSPRQCSLKNWKEIWRQQVTDNKDGYLFLQENGKPFPSEDALRMFLSPFCKPIWGPFSPKKMRDWYAIACLIRSKVDTGDWQVRNVTKALGHKHQNTTEGYVEFAELYYENDKYDWLRAVLKFHPNSKRMLCLMKQPYRSCQKISINAGKCPSPIQSSPVGVNAPVGIRTRVAGSKGRNDWPDYTTGATALSGFEPLTLAPKARMLTTTPQGYQVPM